jgi:hypothetical protein
MSQDKVHAVVTPTSSLRLQNNYRDERRDDGLGATFFRSSDDLARESSLGLNTIKRAELAEDRTSLTVANNLAVRGALKAAGVEFIDETAEARERVYGGRRRPNTPNCRSAR